MKECSQALDHKIVKLEIKVNGEFTEVHQRLNVVTSQLNQIQEQINPEK